MKLDKSRPFGTLSGDPDGAKFIQDGLKFDGKGDAIARFPIETPPTPIATAADTSPIRPADPFSGIHWSKLVKLAKKNGAGEDVINKNTAIAFLQDKGVTP